MVTILDGKTSTLGANVFVETFDLIDKIFASPEFLDAQKNGINLEEKSLLVRLAVINLREHFPTDEELVQWKAALLRPDAFLHHWKNLEVVKTVP